MPGASKKRIWITSGSSGEIWTCTPPARSSILSWWRATAGIATRRSETLTPVAARPEIIARLIMRAAGWASRLTTIRAPRASVVP